MRLALIIVFSLWFFFTILWQFNYFRREKLKFVYKFNILNVLPIWTFFAPTPGISDTHMIYRDKLNNGDITEWEEVPIIENRKWYHFLWNPYKRQAKLVVDALSQVKSLRNRGEELKLDDGELQYHIKLSKGYLVLLNIAMSREKIGQQSISRQFLVVDAYHLTGERQPIPIFSSPFHLIE